MQGKSRTGYRVDYADHAAVASPHRQVALSHAECHRLLQQWADAEMAEIRRVWFPPSSAGYSDYEPPRDPEARLEREVRRMERDIVEIDRTGWAMYTMATAKSDTTKTHAAVLLSAYKGIGKRRREGARRLALEAFGRVFLTWADAVDGPLNSL